MNNTPNTPLQLPDDDRILLRQIAATCRDLDGQVKDLRDQVKGLRDQVQSVNSRLDAMEGSRDTVGKLDRLIHTVAEVQQEMREFKEEMFGVQG